MSPSMAEASEAGFLPLMCERFQHDSIVDANRLAKLCEWLQVCGADTAMCAGKSGGNSFHAIGKP